MKPEVRKELKRLIRKFMKDNNLNWKNMQTNCIKEHLAFPVGWRTLYRFLKKSKDMSVKNQVKIFKHLGVVAEPSIYGVLEIKANEGADIQS